MTDKIFKTRDITYASILKTSKLELIAFDDSSGSMYWTFDDEYGEAEAIIMDFTNGKLEINLKEYLDNFRSLKATIIHNGK